MNEFIKFKPQDARLIKAIRFTFTKKAFENISNNQNEAIAKITEFTNTKFLIITRGKYEDLYEVYTKDGIYLCRVTDDNTTMLVIGFHQNNLMKQNNALRNGVCFEANGGIVAQIKLTQPYELYFDIANGKRFSSNVYDSIDVSNSLNIIAKKINEAYNNKEEEEEYDEEYQPDKKLLNLLDVAESYSILASELEEKKANFLGNIPYNSINAIEYDRIDRVAYQFGINKIDENTFKVGVQVEVEDRNQEKHSAEIIELVKEDQDSPATAIKLLFTEHIDISEFNQSGWFNLSFSTVNKDVQLAANEKIKTGEASAKYMDNILGKHVSAGFDNNDLSEVEAKLKEKQYPPNESQMKAIFAGINVRDVFLVMGPPGPGKTTVILEWVKYFVKQGKRVLVSSQNNKAVDNDLERIADEKYIDIIRVGSESKLQSEVVPYMFENKVTSLRKNISENSEKKIKQIDAIISDWTEHSKKVDALLQAHEIRIQKRAVLNEAINNEFVPIYKKLLSVYNEYKQLQINKDLLITSIKSYDYKIEKYEKYTNILVKLISKRSYERNKEQIVEEVSKYDSLKKREETLVFQYNNLRNEYTEVYKAVKENRFFDLLYRINNEKEKSKAVSTFPSKREENIWDLFDDCRNVRLKNVTDCMNLKNNISKNIKRANQIQNAISLWKQEIEGQQNYALNEIVLESVDLVGATCIGINSQKRFANLDFDVTIIDEAGQIQVHNALVPMSVSNKLIMLGDHKQIPPTADQELIDLCEENGVKTNLLSMSLFEKMYYDLPEENKIMLDTQYRMPAEIADTISEWFYDGKYYSPSFKQNLKSLIPTLSSRPYVIIDTSKEYNRYEHKIEGAGCDNGLEAEIIESIIANISANAENDLKEIGVISAYKSQVKLVKNKLNKILPKELVNEMVATLDSYQGQERDIILYSFTKSSTTSPMKRRIGFLNELRRLNVAMSRCKKMLVLIGDMEFLGGCQHCDKDEEGNLIYEKSEKQFADFINKMVNDVKSGRGEFISYQDFKGRLGQ